MMTMSTYFAILNRTPDAIRRRPTSTAPHPLVFAKTTGTLDGAEKFMRTHLFDIMKEDERAAYAKWRADNHVKEHEFADNMVKSVATTWEVLRDAG